MEGILRIYLKRKRPNCFFVSYTEIPKLQTFSITSCDMYGESGTIFVHKKELLRLFRSCKVKKLLENK